MHILGTYYMFPINYLLISYCTDIYQGITNFIFYSETNNLENLEESLINQILKQSPNLYIIHYVALSILNCREGHRVHPLKYGLQIPYHWPCVFGNKKPLFTKVLTLMPICIVLGLMWGALHMLSHLIPKHFAELSQASNTGISGSKDYNLAVRAWCHYRGRTYVTKNPSEEQKR